MQGPRAPSIPYFLYHSISLLPFTALLHTSSPNGEFCEGRQHVYSFHCVWHQHRANKDKGVVTTYWLKLKFHEPINILCFSSLSHKDRNSIDKH